MIFVEIGGPQEIHAISEAKKRYKNLDLLHCTVTEIY